MLSLSLETSKKHPAIFTYCSFNSFARADVRFRVEFPQDLVHFQLQILPADRSQKITNEITQQVWDELFVSSVVRAVIIGLDRDRKLPTLVEKQLFQSEQQTSQMITKMVSSLSKGSILGARSTVQKPSLYENFLVDALCHVVTISGQFKHAIQQIQTLAMDLTPLIARLLCLMDNEIDAVRYLHRALKVNPRDSLLLNEQVAFLIEKGQHQLALQCALSSVQVNPLNFQSWYWLVMCHLLNRDVKSALVAISSMPMYFPRPKDLVQLDIKDTPSLPEPQEGKVQVVWDSSVQIFGPNSGNMLNFSPRFEIEAADPALKRVSAIRLRGTRRRVYDLLVFITASVGWDQLLKSRADVFLMDDECKSISTMTLNSKAPQLQDGADIRGKRQCDQWLDELFQIVYDDLRITLIVENELSAQKQLKHTALEWELIGLSAYRTAHYKNAVSALRTALGAQFDIVAAMKLLKLWEMHVLNPNSNELRWLNKATTLDISLNDVLRIIIHVISYNIRFYNESHMDIIPLLAKICEKYDKDFIKNNIQIIFENDNNDFANSGVIPPFDQLINVIETFKP